MSGLDVTVVKDAEMLAGLAAYAILAVAEATVSAEGRCSIALAGGSTPKAAYKILATGRLAPPFDRLYEQSFGRPSQGLPWHAMNWYFGDERCVAPDAPESNYRMAKEALFDPATVPADRVHRMEAERNDREAAAAEYAEALPEAFDLVLLGMGDDGHCASLFPGSAALRETTRRAVLARSPIGIPWRITITPPVLAVAKKVLVLVSGAGKAARLVEVLEGPLNTNRLPAQLARGGTWMVDAEAAAFLSGRKKE